MCGIIGYVGRKHAGPLLYTGLQNLEYRGYDSAGITVLDDGFLTHKAVGEVSELQDSVDLPTLTGNVGIGHTRWATHGGVTEENAHPHTCCTGRVSIVHNGIIENFDALKAELDHHDFTSETDSEVIAHFLADRLENGDSVHDAITSFLQSADGAFAVAALDRETGELYGFKNGSPLTIGVSGHGHFLGSDVHAFGAHTQDTILLNDGEYAVMDQDTVQVFDTDQQPIDRDTQHVDATLLENEKGDYDHYMLKEIHEQPAALQRLRDGLEHTQHDAVERLAELIRETDKVIFTAAGTSYHASLLGVYYLQKAGIEAQTLIASEFQNYERVDENTLLIAVSQSGETRDTLDAIEYSKDRGATIASIVNVPHSAISRESTVTLDIQAGRETCVAATKTFTNTVYTLLHLARALGYDGEQNGLPEQLQTVITENEDRIAALAHDLREQDDMYIIGRGPTYPVSRELALKLKEIPYVHAEGMMGGELKHGTLALIEDDTPVIALVPEEDDPIVSNVHEVEARGGNVITVSPHRGDFVLPEGRDGFPFFATTFGFLLSYYLGVERDCPIDKPRNLAKTVTVR